MKRMFLSLSLLALSLGAVAPAFAQAPAKLIAYRKSSFYGGLARYQVNVDNKPMGTLKGSSIVEASLAPGMHTISPKQSGRAIKLNAEPGQTYVVKYQTRFGLLGARPKLKIVPFDKAKMDSKYFAEHAGM